MIFDALTRSGDAETIRISSARPATHREARRTPRRINYSGIPEASLVQLKVMRRTERRGKTDRGN
jgi:hypothetical protein